MHIFFYASSEKKFNFLPLTVTILPCCYGAEIIYPVVPPQSVLVYRVPSLRLGRGNGVLRTDVTLMSSCHGAAVAA